MDKNEKVAECEILIYFRKTIRISIIIAIVTGIFLVKGQSYNNKIDEEFPKVNEILKLNDFNIKLQSSSVNQNEYDNMDEKKGALSSQSNRYAEKDYEISWEAINKNEKAINNLDQSMLNLIRLINENNSCTSDLSRLG